MPLTCGGRAVGASLLERSEVPAFDAQTVLMLEAVFELVLAPARDARSAEKKQPL